MCAKVNGDREAIAHLRAVGLRIVVRTGDNATAKDDYTQMLIWKTTEAKRTQAQIPERLHIAMFKFHPLASAK